MLLPKIFASRYTGSNERLYMQKVLLVEDDQLISRLYQKTLTHENFETQVADNGLSALELLPDFNPDIILLDIMMPTMNGIDFLGNMKMKPATANIPVIVLTNVSDSDATQLAVNAGASLILIKSQTEPDDVVAAIRGVLAKRILQTENLEAVESEDE
jgi:DNA-binding response OmpR family regulator